MVVQITIQIVGLSDASASQKPKSFSISSEGSKGELFLKSIVLFTNAAWFFPWFIIFFPLCWFQKNSR
jgi:hypothetical protein